MSKLSSSMNFILFWSFVKKCSKTTSILYFIIILKINHKQKERKNFKILYFLTNFQQITQKSLWFTYIISLWKISKVQKKTYNLPTPIWLKKGGSFFYLNQINNKNIIAKKSRVKMTFQKKNSSNQLLKFVL